MYDKSSVSLEKASITGAPFSSSAKVGGYPIINLKLYVSNAVMNSSLKMYHLLIYPKSNSKRKSSCSFSLSVERASLLILDMHTPVSKIATRAAGTFA